MHLFLAFREVDNTARAETAMASTGYSPNASNPFSWTALLSVKNSTMSIASWFLKKGK